MNLRDEKIKTCSDDGVKSISFNIQKRILAKINQLLQSKKEAVKNGEANIASVQKKKRHITNTSLQSYNIRV